MKTASSGRSTIRYAGAVLFAVSLAACGDDGPSGPSDDFDVVGQWSWRVTDATASGVTCSISNVTLTFTRANGTLSGHRVSSGGGNINCTANGQNSTANYTTNDAIDDLSLNGTAIQFSFATSTGLWQMSGNVTNDDSMGGTATIRLGTTTGTIALTGPWTATRN